jgi:hypothetical protein
MEMHQPVERRGVSRPLMQSVADRMMQPLDLNAGIEGNV